MPCTFTTSTLEHVATLPTDAHLVPHLFLNDRPAGGPPPPRREAHPCVGGGGASDGGFALVERRFRVQRDRRFRGTQLRWDTTPRSSGGGRSPGRAPSQTPSALLPTIFGLAASIPPPTVIAPIAGDEPPVSYGRVSPDREPAPATAPSPVELSIGLSVGARITQPAIFELLDFEGRVHMTNALRSVRAKRVHVGPYCVIVAWLNVCVVVWRHQTSAEDVRLVSDALHSLSVERREGVGLVQFLDDRSESVSLDAQARAAISELLVRGKNYIKCSSIVFTGQGFRASAVRAVITRITWLARPGFPHQVFATAASAAEAQASLDTGRIGKGVVRTPRPGHLSGARHDRALTAAFRPDRPPPC